MPMMDAGAFSWDRVAARQCVSGVKYTVPDQCEERDHFTKYAANVLGCVKDGLGPKTQLMQKISEVVASLKSGDQVDYLQEFIKIKYIEYAQLKKIVHVPNLTGRAPPADDPEYQPAELFESFDVVETVSARATGAPPKAVIKKMVQAPVSEGGWYAEVLTTRALMYKMTLEFDVNFDEDFNVAFNEDADGDGPQDPPMKYGMCLEYGLRTKFGIYESFQKATDHVIKISVGHFGYNNRFIAWKPDVSVNFNFTCISADPIATQLFDERVWPKESNVRREDPETVEGGAMDDNVNGPSRGRYSFCERNDRLCYMTIDKASGGKEPEPVELCNFHITKVLALYQFVEQGELPLFKLLCRLRISPMVNGADNVLYVSAGMCGRAPDPTGYTVLEVEAVICTCILKSPAEVKTAFQDAHGLLQTTALTPEQLSCYLVAIPQPLPSSVIVRWGKQESGWWVVGNCAFKDGVITTVEDSKHAISPSFFNRNINCPMPAADFPKIIQIPFPHVRYMIAAKMWAECMPAFFQNNEQPAKAVFALGVMGLHADRFWAGEAGMGHGMPVGWVYSVEHGSGKTEACLNAHSSIGFYNRAIWAGDATKAVTFESSNMECNMMKFIDDVVPSDKGNGEFQSKALAQLVRSFYDHTARAVSGKIRRPMSGCCFTANCTVNDDDKAFQSRLLTIPFKELKTTDTETADDPVLYNTFLLNRELMSACMPDMAMLGLWNGKLDKHAIQDWSQFLQKALAKKRDRNLNEWAKLGYFLSILNVCFQCGSEDQMAMMDWMLVSVTKATHELTNHAGLMDQFVIAILKVKETIAPNLLGPNPDKMLFWHNLRTNTAPFGSSEKYWAVRVGLVCHVLKTHIGKAFKETDINAAVTESGWATHGKGRFYNHSDNPWPIKSTIMPQGDTGMGLGYIDVPLAENDLLNEHLTSHRCIYIKVQYIDQIRASIEGSGNLEVNYKNVVINSSNRELTEPYNFYNAVCHDGWWGYRTLEQSSFRTFCGAMNEMQIGSPTSELKILHDVEADIKTCGFHSIAHCFNPAILLEWFSYSPLAPEFCGSLPACYTKLPFEFRNGWDDESPTDPMRDILIKFFPSSPPASPTRNGGGSQSNGADTPMRRTGPGTGQSPGRRRPQPSPLGSRNADDDDAVAPPLKRNRRSKFIIDEASGDEDMDEVRAPVSKTPANATLTLSCHYPHFFSGGGDCRDGGRQRLY